jgi:hypothetical protein
MSRDLCFTSVVQKRLYRKPLSLYAYKTRIKLKKYGISSLRLRILYVCNLACNLNQTSPDFIYLFLKKNTAIHPLLEKKMVLYLFVSLHKVHNSRN